MKVFTNIRDVKVKFSVNNKNIEQLALFKYIQ